MVELKYTLKKYFDKYINYFIIIPIVCCVVLSLRHIDYNSIWPDEAWSITFANLNWRKLLSVMSQRELNMGLYYISLKVWITIFGESELAVRSLSVLFSVCAIIMTFAIGKRLFDAKIGLIAGSILAVNAFFIEYSQEARAYTLLIFMANTSVYYFIKILQDQRLKNCVLYVITSALLVYSHLFGLFIIMVQAISVLLLTGEKINYKKLFLCALSVTILIAPVVYFILFKDNGQISWISKPSVKDIYDLFISFTGDGGNGILLILYIIPCLFCLLISFQYFLEFKMTRLFWRYAFLLCWLLIPIIIAYLISSFKPMFISKYLISSMIPLVLLVSVGLSTIKNKYFYMVAISVLISFSVYTVFHEYYPKQKFDWRSATRYISEYSQKGDGITFYDYSAKVSFEYYYRRLNVEQDKLNSVYPSPLGIHSFYPLGNPDEKSLSKIHEKYNRLWCVLDLDMHPEFETESCPMINKLKEKYIINNSRIYKGVKIILLERNDNYRNI